MPASSNGGHTTPGRGRYDYLLTDKGRALWPVMTTLRQWGDEWILGAGNEPLLLEHRDHGHTTTAQLTCDVCGEPLDARSVRAIPGPGDTLRISTPTQSAEEDR